MEIVFIFRIFKDALYDTDHYQLLGTIILVSISRNRNQLNLQMEKNFLELIYRNNTFELIVDKIGCLDEHRKMLPMEYYPTLR